MDGRFHLSKIELGSMANELNKMQEECNALVNKIYGTVGELNSCWKDGSEVAYVQNIESFKPSLNRLIKAIGDYSLCIVKAVNLHSETEAENAAQARSINTEDIKM